MAAATRTIAVVAREIILNSLMKGVISEEIALSSSEATIGIPLMREILTGVVQSIAVCTYP